jgi:hypothetical protein
VYDFKQGRFVKPPRHDIVYAILAEEKADESDKAPTGQRPPRSRPPRKPRPRT